MSKRGVLYLVPTPVGNLGDMTLRAIETLRDVAVIACEDTRTSGVLLKHYDIATPTISYHQHNERQRSEQLVQRLLQGEDVAVISDAGAPGLSDPAAVLVQAAVQAGVVVSPLPGATALVPAITGSALPTERFYYAGFAPHKQSERDALLRRLAPLPDTLVFYEAPHRMRAFLEELLAVLGDRRVCLARELSKHFESFHRGRLSELLAENSEVVWKGEFVVVVEGAEQREASDEEIAELLREQLSNGERRKQAVKVVCEQTGAARNRVYDLSLRLDDYD